MRAYTIHAPPDAPSAAERLVFVKDGFSWPAFLVPVPWLLYRRLWLALLGYVIFVLVVAWTWRLASDDIAAIVAIAGSLLLALEGNDIRRRSLAGRGWIEMGGSFGQNLDEAEIRFFQRGEPGRAGSNALWWTADDTRQHSSAATGDEPIFGLFPEPER